ncbi:MAG: hypothetical protein ABIG70_04910 [Pseudomonadota bacterium]
MLRAIAELCGAKHSADRPISNSPNAAFAAGLATSDFKALLSDFGKSATLAQLTAHSAHKQICATRRLINFKQTLFPSADLRGELVEMEEGAEAKTTVHLSETSGLYAKLRTFGTNVFVSEVLIKNDDVGALASLFGNIGAESARLEARMVYSLLESNTTLSDGELMFHTGHGNIVASALDSNSLGAGMAALHNQPTPGGGPANLGAEILLVSPELELTARTLINQAGMKITVISSPWLATGRWYLIAKPELAPVIGLLRLGTAPDGVITGPARDNKIRTGVLVAVRADLGAVALGRVGIIKGGV